MKQETKLGTIEDAYIKTLELVLQYCTENGKRELREKLDFLSAQNTGECTKLNTGDTIIYASSFIEDKKYYESIAKLQSEMQIIVEWYRGAGEAPIIIGENLDESDDFNSISPYEDIFDLNSLDNNCD